MTTPATEDEQEFTELVDFRGGRIDLVGKGANGIPRFLIAKGADGQGLLDADDVRALISKSEPAAGSQGDAVTVTGSPAAIAQMIHDAAQAQVAKNAELEAVAKAMDAYPDDSVEVAKAKAEYDLIVKAKYNADDRKRMAGSGAAMKDGSYPIEDEADLHDAIRAVGRGGASHNAIRKHIISRAKSLGKSSLIPDNWAADGSLKEKVSKDMAMLTDVDLDPALDESRNADDLETPLAAPDEDAPGDPSEPGSPAWEAIDAATACKWTSILSRARVAIDMLSEREMLEAATGDEDDIEHAMDLGDVCCAIDFAISVLAPYAVAEQSEVDTGAAAIAKAMAGFDPAPLDVLETLAAVAKAGRVLSAANEAQIRSAAESLNQVLASLPQAPVAGEPVTKEEGAMEPVTKEATPDEQAAANGPVNAGGTTGLGEPRVTGPEGALPADGPQASKPGDTDRQVIKADDKPAMQAVFDADGNLVGIVDPAQITPVAGASKTDDGSVAAMPEGAGDDANDNREGGMGDADDLTPQPADATGVPAENPPADDNEDNAVAKSEVEPDGEQITVTKAELSSLVAAEVQGILNERDQAVAKAAEAGAEVEVLKAEVARLGEQPAPPGVFTNGQVPPAHQLRGQDRPQGGAATVDVAKAAELKGVLYRGTAPEQNQAAKDMQEMAIAALAQVHQRR